MYPDKAVARTPTILPYHLLNVENMGYATADASKQRPLEQPDETTNNVIFSYS